MSAIVRGPFASLRQARGGGVRLEPFTLKLSISEKEEKSLDGTYTRIQRMAQKLYCKHKV